MYLYLLRHGIAGPALLGEPDASRVLTSQGVALLKLQAKGFARAGIQVDQLFSSPLTRAQQTSEIVASFLHTPVEVDELAGPGCSLTDIQELANRNPENQQIMIVGHQPDMGRLVRQLTGCNARIRTGTLAHIEVASIRPNGGILIGLYDPEYSSRVVSH